MKNLLAISFVFCLFLLQITACKPKDGDNTKINPISRQPFDLMSTKPGSYWIYVSDAGKYSRRFPTGTDSLMMGKTYCFYQRIDSGTTTPEPEYFGKFDYYFVNLLDIDGKKTNYIDYIFWKDGTGAGTSFTNTGTVTLDQIGKMDLEINCSIVEDDLVMTVANEQINKVIHAHSDVYGYKLGQKTKIANTDIWFKKGFGVLKQEVDMNVLGVYKRYYRDSVVAYYIAP